uniref:Uncharacterized protein n=1 Tax=Glossina morsitans morsitans TaxID=37546 RepID=A0ABK9NGB4_GLOMM
MLHHVQSKRSVTVDVEASAKSWQYNQQRILLCTLFVFQILHLGIFRICMACQCV